MAISGLVPKLMFSRPGKQLLETEAYAKHTGQTRQWWKWLVFQTRPLLYNSEESQSSFDGLPKAQWPHFKFCSYLSRHFLSHPLQHRQQYGNCQQVCASTAGRGATLLTFCIQTKEVSKGGGRMASSLLPFKKPASILQVFSVKMGHPHWDIPSCA